MNHINFTDSNIPETLLEIDNNAFERCKNLKSITIPFGLKKIEKMHLRGVQI